MSGSQDLKKIVFMGSPAFAVPSLRALHAAGHEIVAVFSQPPRPAGRGQKLQKTAVHEAAEELGLVVYTPERLRGDDLEFVMGLKADVFCVVAYGLLLPKRMVDEKLCLNVHPSALPRWRGAAPLQWTLIAGDSETDVCVMKLDEGMDTGPVVAREGLSVPSDWNCAKLGHVTADIGARMLVEVVDGLPNIRLVPQEGEATHAVKITKDMRRVDWNRDALEIFNRVRGMNPSPNATGQLGDEVFKIYRTEVVHMDGIHGAAGTVLKVNAGGIDVACGQGILRLLLVHRPGKDSKPDAGIVVQGWPDMAVGAKLV